MSKMIHDQPSAAVPASRDRRNFLIAGAGLALAATTLGRSGAVMAKPAGQDTPNAPSDAAPVRKETQIWATEHAKNRLHRVRLSDATTVAPFGSVVTYQFTGPAPDGARVDSEGNVYVAIFIASNYVCDRVLHWYKGNQHAPLNGVMSFFHKQTTFSYASLGPKSV